MGIPAALAARVDGWVDGFCAACDGPRLAYGRIVKPPALLGPMAGGRQSTRRRVPSRRKLLRIVRLLEYFHRVRGRRQSVPLAELARAVEAGGDEWLLSDAPLRSCSYFQASRRRVKRGVPRQTYLKLDVRDPWQTLADVIDVLGRGEAGGADVELVVKVFYALCPGFNKLLPKGLSGLRDLFAAFPGTFAVSAQGRVRCAAPFDDPLPEHEIAACYRNDVHTREDLEGIVALAQAAASYPGVKSGCGIPVEALHAWGRARHAGVPCWRGIGSFRRFLYAFRKSGYYRLGEGTVLSYGWRGAGCRIKAIRTVIRVVGEADGFACCATVADIVNRWVPGFGGRLDEAGFVRYVRDLKGGDFVLDGDDRIADRLVSHDVRGHVACWYYARYLAKQRVLGEGLLRGMRGGTSGRAGMQGLPHGLPGPWWKGARGC